MQLGKFDCMFIIEIVCLKSGLTSSLIMRDSMMDSIRDSMVD